MPGHTCLSTWQTEFRNTIRPACTRRCCSRLQRTLGIWWAVSTALCPPTGAWPRNDGGILSCSTCPALPVNPSTTSFPSKGKDEEMRAMISRTPFLFCWLMADRANVRCDFTLSKLLMAPLFVCKPKARLMAFDRHGETAGCH